jgi:glycosyltransferase involved in cell wall biosynthesis
MPGRFLEVLCVRIGFVLISEGWGGAETVVHELAKHMRTRGHETSLFVNREILEFYGDLQGLHVYNIGRMQPFESVAVSRLRLRYGYNPIGRLVWLLTKYLDAVYRVICFPRVGRLISGILLENKVEVIHSHLADAIWLASHISGESLLKVATVHYHILYPFSSPRAPLVRWKRREVRESLANMDFVTAVSGSVLRQLLAWEPRVRRKTAMIRNGISISEIRRTHGIHLKHREDLKLLFPGGAKRGKGGSLVIQALALVHEKIPTVHCYIALDVPLGHPMRRMASAMHLDSNITFVGFLPVQKYRSLLKSVDFFVLPSYGEGAPVSCMEAMALGKPIIAGKTGGVPEVVKTGRNGILVDLNPEQIAAAVLRLWRNKRQAQTITRNNLQDALKYDWTPIADEYVDLFRRVLKERRRV